MRFGLLNLAWIRDWPIRQKLMFVITLTCTVVLLFACALLGYYQIHKFRESLVRSATVLADVIASNTQAALAFQDESAAQQTLKALHADSYVTSACLYDAADVHFATYVAPNGTSTFPDRPGASGTRFESDALVVVRPVLLGRRQMGTIYIRSSLEGLNEQLGFFALFAVFVFIVSGLVALALSSRLQRPISRPILALTDAARRISVDKDFSIRVPSQGRDEAGQLTDAMNQLLTTIQERDRALRAEIVERKEAEKALVDSEQRLQALMQALPVGVSFSTDATCQRITGNATLLVMLEGRAQDNISASAPDAAAHGRAIRFFQAGRPVDSSELPLQRAVAENREIKPVEFEVVLPSGHRWIMETSGAPVRDLEGRVIAGVAVSIDITERKRVETALQEVHAQLADRALHLESLVEQRTAKLRETIGDLEAFSYSIAHDMRAPLRSLQGYSRILLSEHAGQLDEDARNYLQRIEKSAGRMDRLIQDVLNYSRVVRSDVPLESVDIGQLLHGIVDTYPMFSKEHADITLQPPLPAVQGNEAMLTQIFSNLIGNAVKFVPKNTRPQIKVWAEPSGPRTRFFVRDNGIGIDPSQTERIFAIFQQASKGYEGTGIGLAIVKKAVERMDGRIGVESEVGRGSTFWIEFHSTPPPS